MLVNLVLWLGITMVIFPFGIVIATLYDLPLNKLTFIELLLLGLLPITLLSTASAFLIPINLEFFAIAASFSLSVSWYYRRICFEKVMELVSQWLKLSFLCKTCLGLFLLFTGIQASMPTNIPDQGHYYLQTIKWAGNYGIPSNVVQFGMQYGQFSSWHILQAVFNFSAILGNRLNAVNGWLLVMFIVFIVEKYQSNQSKGVPLFCLISVFCSAGFQFFVTAPSPDLPIILLTIIVFYYHLFEGESTTTFKIICMLSLAALTYKITSFFLFFLLPFYSKAVIMKCKWLSLPAIVVALLIVSKSMVTAGTPIFPFDIDVINESSSSLISRIIKDGKDEIWSLTAVNADLSLLDLELQEKINMWLFQLGYKSFINLLWIGGIILAGFFSMILKSKVLFQVFIISFVHFILLWLTAPNYRFAIPLIIICYCVLLINSGINLYFGRRVVYLTLLLSGVWITPISGMVLNLSQNGIVSRDYPVRWEYLIMPTKQFVSKEYELAIFNGEKVYLPPNYFYCWDGPIPCVMRYHYEKYHNFGH